MPNYTNTQIYPHKASTNRGVLLKELRREVAIARDRPYGKVALRVLKRDGFTCQLCGNRRELDVHHVRFRSQGGDDSFKNLLTLSRECHAAIHMAKDQLWDATISSQDIASISNLGSY